MSWLSDASANRLIQSYAKNFVDVSGNFKVRSEEPTTVDTGPVSWSQLGSDIDGEAAGDQSGYTVSLSSDGTIMAVGAIRNSDNGYRAGHVRVYEWNGSSWSQLGSDIDGSAAGDNAGRVSLSSDGTILAIGAIFNDGNGSNSGQVRVYKWNGSSWTQLGSDIYGEAAEDRAGIWVSLSSDGTIVAIGSDLNDSGGSNSGQVRVFEWNGSSWNQIGNDINGQATEDRFGYSVSLSNDGSIVAMGGYKHDTNGTDSGYVRVFQYSYSTWSQLGSDIDGEASGDNSGFSVSLSDDGTIVAIGAHGNDGNGSNSGHVRVYEWNGSSWSQLGSDIDGEAAGDGSGSSVSLSSDGTILAIGAYNNDGGGSSSGHVRVYEYANSTWTQIGSDIDGEASTDYSAFFALSLSSDGTIVAIGAYSNNGNGTDSGHTRVYQKTGGLVTTTTSVEALDVSGGTINMLQNTMKVSPEVVDINGTSWINRGQSGNTISEAYQKGLIIESSSTSSSDAVIYVETSGQAEAFSVRANGAMYSANTLRHSSDDRRKINEQYITNATQTLKKLSPQIYTKLNDLLQNGGTPTKTESGLIAQEIYYNAPELRHLVHSDGQPLPYDLSGTALQNDPDYSALGWGSKSATVDYIGLIPYLIKSNQEQQESIDNKQQQIVDNKKALEEDIQSRIAALET